MWLINTKTLRLEQIVDPSSVDYAILSHTWGDDEVSFKDMQRLSRAKEMTGFVKISKTCKLALKKNLRYAWVDTCCIDKTSSAELSEAINAMFVWYQAAAVCVVWLEDLAPSSSASKIMSHGRKLHDLSEMSSCKWFSRGWTLQELIAPANVRFYDASWNFRFTKENNVSTLATITAIDVDVLKMVKRLKDVLVAVKMSWAANRETTRPEDIAYCLLGIFDINMPMLYGEGEKAFQRLQEHIVNLHTDTSIFAWLAPFRPPLPTQSFRGLFATSPQQFASSGHISRELLAVRPDVTLENKGIRVSVDIYTISRSKYVQMPLHLKCLTCDMPHEIFISLLSTQEGYVRMLSESCLRIQDRQKYQITPGHVYCRRMVDPEHSEALECFASKPIEIRMELDTSQVVAWPASAWNWYTFSFCGDALSDDFWGLLYIYPVVLQPLCLALVINKLVNEDIELRFFYENPVNGRWWIVGGSRKEDIWTHTWMDMKELSKGYKATKPSHLYGQKASVWFKCTCPEEEDNNAKIEAVVNGPVITISLSTWSSDVEEVEGASICDSIEGAVSHDNSSSQARQTPSPEPDNEWKPRRSKRLKMKKQ